ncbi:hypothetical protein FSP39_004910 [Pinctada imbricata]|uniref:Uncharacterized protein n=1 Tax=Pinctada imbricata TaxID=66713 RepID=A0AA89BIT1_PINIB|nr:hypothetical protein FSP39_004910 [Pinctada imbricata]
MCKSNVCGVVAASGTICAGDAQEGLQLAAHICAECMLEQMQLAATMCRKCAETDAASRTYLSEELVQENVCSKTSFACQISITIVAASLRQLVLQTSATLCRKAKIFIREGVDRVKGRWEEGGREGRKRERGGGRGQEEGGKKGAGRGSGIDSPKIDINCSGSQLFNVSTITHVFKVSKILEDERTYIIGDFQVEGSETDSYVKTVTHRTVNESEIDDMMYNRPIPTTTKESFTIKDIRTSERTSMKHVSTAQTTAVFKSSSSGILTSHDLHQPSTLASETTASTFALSKQHEIEATLTVSTVIELKTESRLSLEVATRKRETMDKKPSDYGTEPKGDNYVVIVVVAILLLLMVLTAVGVTIWIKRQKEDMKRMRRTTRSEIWPDFTQQASVESSVGSVGIASPNVIFDNSMPNEHNRGHSN